MRVAVLSGGRSSEHDVSLRSGASVAAGLRAGGHEAVEILIARDGGWSCGGEGVQLTPGAGLLGVDAAFPALHGPFGEDGSVQGLLECIDLPYVGADVLASALCMDKLSFKRVLAYYALPQVGFVQAGEPDWRRRALTLGLPLWVKPSRLGSSVGISKVTSESALGDAVEAAARHDPRVIIEASAQGREVECSVIGNDELETSVPGEILTEADWYDYEAKYSQDGMELVAPAQLPPAVGKRVRELAAQVFGVTGCSGLARCDFFVIGDEVLVNELNTIPGFTETSVFSKLFEVSGIAYADLCERLVTLAVERHQRARSYEF